MVMLPPLRNFSMMGCAVLSLLAMRAGACAHASGKVDKRTAAKVHFRNSLCAMVGGIAKKVNCSLGILPAHETLVYEVST
jgi:hypothetical protein